MQVPEGADFCTTYADCAARFPDAVSKWDTFYQVWLSNTFLLSPFPSGCYVATKNKKNVVPSHEYLTRMCVERALQLPWCLLCLTTRKRMQSWVFTGRPCQRRLKPQLCASTGESKHWSVNMQSAKLCNWSKHIVSCRMISRCQCCPRGHGRRCSRFQFISRQVVCSVQSQHRLAK